MATDSTIDNLHHACFHGLLDKVKQLHSQGISLNARCSAGQTPLSSSTLGVRVEVIKYLIANGVDVNEQDSKRKFALYFAVAQVGMRVRRCAQNSTELGVITRLGTDGGSELAVQWDGGGTDNNVKAGKRGNTDQQGIDLGPARHAIEQAGNSADDFTPDRISECARRTRPLRRCPGRAPAREKDRGCPRMVPQCGMDDGAYSRTVCAHRAQSQGERGGEGPETAGLSIFAHAWTGNSRTSIFAHAWPGGIPKNGPFDS